MKRQFSFAILLLSAATCVGCRMPYKVQLGAGGAPQYQNVDVTYDLRSSRLTAGAVDDQGIRQASAVVSQTPLDGTWPAARLRIEFPHPEAREGYARATLRVGRSPIEQETPTLRTRITQRLFGGGPEPEFDACNPELHDEVWALDIRKSELDSVLVALAQRGYFDDQTRPTGEAQIRIQIDRGETRKVWTSEPALDALISRIHTEGWLAGFIDCQEQGVQQTGWSF